jgi:hypothetical protein
MSNIFEQATRNKFRFASVRGNITTENLWDLPLESRDGFDLDSVAKAVNSDLKSVTEESFVKTTANPIQEILETKLEIVKYIISVKQTEAEAAKAVLAKHRQRAKLVEILARKQDASLESLTEEQIREKIDAL